MSLLNPGDEVLNTFSILDNISRSGKDLRWESGIIVDTEFDEDFKINTDQLDALKTI